LDGQGKSTIRGDAMKGFMLLTGSGLLLLLASHAAISAAGPPDGQQAGSATSVVVTTTEQLLEAVGAARPGAVIRIAPGTYKATIRFERANSGAAGAPVVLTARDGLGTAVIDGGGASITVKLSGAAHVEIRDLEITGGGHHGIFLDRGARHITISHNRIYDNHRIRPLNSHAELKGSGGEGRPSDVAIVDNEIFHRAHPPGGNFQGIDCNFCDRFRIEGNDLHDINSPTTEPYPITTAARAFRSRAAPPGRSSRATASRAATSGSCTAARAWPAPSTGAGSSRTT
jgi:hypothetical protein